MRSLNGRRPRSYASTGPTRQVVNTVMDATPPHTHPAPVHSLPPALSRLRRWKRHRHCRRELRELLAPSSSCLTSPPSVSESASSSSIFSTTWLAEISPRWAAFRRIAVVGFTPVATPIPANLAAAPSTSSFFSPSHVRACLGHRRRLCHAIPALVTPSCGNTVAVPPRSPSTTILHVRRLTGAIRVRPFYLESSALSHWCLSSPFPTLYRSEMAGVSWGSSARAAMADGDSFPSHQPLNPLPLSTRNDSRSTLVPLDPPEKLTVGEHSPASVLSVSSIAYNALPVRDGRLSPLFYLNSRFLAILQKSYLQFLSSKSCERNFVMIRGMASF